MLHAGVPSLFPVRCPWFVVKDQRYPEKGMNLLKCGRLSKGVLLVLSGLWGCGAPAAIDDRTFSDTRAVGMGGAASATVYDSAAGLINPAVLGFMARETDPEVDNYALGRQSFGWNILDLGLGATLTGSLGDYLQVLADTDFDRFEPPALQEPENILALLELAGVLGAVSDEDTIVATATAGSMVQMGNLSIGLRTYGQVGGWINDLDLVNLGLRSLAEDLATDLRSAMEKDEFDPDNYEPEILTEESIQKLKDAFGGTGANDDVVEYLDYKTVELIDKNGLDADQIKGAVDTLADIIAASADGETSLLDNQTSITGRGFLAVEVPLSYGYAINDNWAVGLTARAIFGRVYGTQVWAFNEDNEEILKDSLDSSVDRVNVGLDAALMYRIPKWQFALTGHNLNRPVFDGYDQTLTINGAPQTVRVPDVVLDPQITFGAAWLPLRRLTLATDLELLETGTLLNGYDVQRISLGSELDLPLLALRLGTYRNIAEEDLGWVLTGGVGLNLWALAVDLGAAVSINDTVNYDGVDYPRTIRAHASISMDF
jgi:hypothetical protein